MYLMFCYNEFWIYVHICSLFKSILLYRVNKIMFTAIPKPFISGHFSKSRGWPLNIGRTVIKITLLGSDLKETFSPTCRIVVNVFPAWSVSLASCCIVDNSSLFSSQLPLLFSSKDSLKFVEVHHECLKHAWLHDTRLDGWIFNTASLAKRLFCQMTKLADLEFSSFATIVVTKKHKNIDQIIFSRRLNCSSSTRFGREELLRKSCWFVA